MARTDKRAKTTGVAMMRMIWRCCFGCVYRCRCLTMSHRDKTAVAAAHAMLIRRMRCWKVRLPTMGSPTSSKLASSFGSGHALLSRESDLICMLNVIVDTCQGEAELVQY